MSLSEDTHSDVIEAFDSTSRYLDDLLNIDNNFFESMVNRIYSPELQLKKANVSDTKASFLDLHLSMSDGFVKTKIYDKRDDFVECQVMLMTLILVIRFWQQNFSDKDIDILKLVRRFKNFIGGILT